MTGLKVVVEVIKHIPHMGELVFFFVQHPWTVAEVLRAFLASSFLLDIVNHAFAYSTNVVGAFDTDELVLGFRIGIQSKR